MSFSDLIARAEYSIDNDQPSTAVPILKEIISRAGSLDDKAARESVQMARLQLGSSLLKLQRMEEARKYAKEYLDGDPVDDRMAALQILSQIAMAGQNWKELKTTAETMLAENLGRKKKETAEQFLLQAYYSLEEYDKATELLPELLKRTKEEKNVRAYQIMQLRCLFETGKTDELIAVLPVMFRGDARDDIRLNLNLLQIGDQLFDRMEYRKALAIYRLVMPKVDLLARHQKKMDSLNAEDENEAAEREELGEIMQTLRDVPDYDIHIAYRAGQIYSEQKRYWEAVVLFDQLYRRHQDMDEGQAAYFQKILVLFEIGADEEAIKECIAYLDEKTSGLFPRMICTRLAQHYLSQKEQKEALTLKSYLDRWTRAADEDEKAQETDLLYMLSFAHFQLGEYDDAFATFDRLIRLDPQSPAAIDSNYWQAMCRLLQQKYEVAYEQFMKYRKSWPQATFASTALFRSGVCRFGLEDYEGAKKLFKEFIDNYPTDEQMPSALAMYADLLAADGEIDQALVHYDRALKIVEENYARATDPELKKEMVTPATYAVMQAARALQADAGSYADQGEIEMVEIKYRLIIHWMERYNNSFGEDADWAQGIFWIGKAQMELGEPEKAVQSYLDAVVRFGADPAQEGVTSILFDLVGMIKSRLPQDRFDPTVESIRQARDKAEVPALRIRLEVLLAELDGTSAELGQALLKREKDIKVVPPSGLALMCSALLEINDYSRSQEFFDHFEEHYEDSPFRVMSYKLRGLDLYEQKKTDEAFAMAEEALGFYGATEHTGWAQLMKGQIEMQRGEYKQAVETFNAVFAVRSWRGPIAAEAMFTLAQAWEQQKNYEKAFAFYQRTYLLYKAYDEGKWAADGYIKSAEMLQKMGRVTAARNTYRAMLLDGYVKELPQAEAAMKILGPEETATLLAGGTNTFEIVELEGSE